MSPDGATIACAGITGVQWDKAVSIYIFERATSRLIQRIPRLPEAVARLAWSPDGRFLAAALLGRHGVRVFRAEDGAQIGADSTYSDVSMDLDFGHGHTLAATSTDGMIRLYRVGEKSLTLSAKRLASDDKEPFAVRGFSRMAPKWRLDIAIPREWTSYPRKI